MLHVVFVQPSLLEAPPVSFTPMAEKRADGVEGLLAPADETSRTNILLLDFDDSSYPPAKGPVGNANLCPIPHPNDAAHGKLRSIRFLHGLSLSGAFG